MIIENLIRYCVISAGFGNKSHPTQALIDISTLYSLNKINEKRTPVTYVGDVKHSRVLNLEDSS